MTVKDECTYCNQPKKDNWVLNLVCEGSEGESYEALQRMTLCNLVTWVELVENDQQNDKAIYADKGHKSLFVGKLFGLGLQFELLGSKNPSLW